MVFGSESNQPLFDDKWGVGFVNYSITNLESKFGQWLVDLTNKICGTFNELPVGIPSTPLMFPLDLVSDPYFFSKLWFLAMDAIGYLSTMNKG